MYDNHIETNDVKNGVIMNVINAPKVEIHISEVIPGDTVLHNGEAKTVCRNNIKHTSLGITLFGDCYALGNKKVIKLLLRK